MIYILILAGGVGRRMKSEMPKQFINLSNKPIIIHTIEKFFTINQQINIVIVCNKDWIKYCRDLLDNYFPNKNLKIANGGNSRNDSIRCGIQYLNENFKMNDNDIIITHDAVRPFVSRKIILDNIELLLNKKDNNQDFVVDTIINSTDTIVECNDIEVIKIPDRRLYYNGQTPQCGYFSTINKIYQQKYDSEIFDSTDMCKLALLNNISCLYTIGDYYNIKITNEFDLFLAKLIVGAYE